MNILIRRIRDAEGSIESDIERQEGIMAKLIRYENAKLEYQRAVKNKLPEKDQEVLLDLYMESSTSYFKMRDGR